MTGPVSNKCHTHGESCRMSVVCMYTGLPLDLQADQWEQLWGIWKVIGKRWVENYHVSCSTGLPEAVLGIDMCISWNRCDRKKPGLRCINSLSSPLPQGSSFCCWLWLLSLFHTDDQQLAWEHNSDFEQRNCHVDRYCPCMQRPKY